MSTPWSRVAGSVAATVVAVLVTTATTATAGNVDTYRVTLENLTLGQPLSPAVAATHRNNVWMFQVGRMVSGEAEMLAESGDQTPLYWALDSSQGVRDLVDLGAPLVPAGTAQPGLSHRATFDLEAGGGDRLSIMTMLVCTNDGFTGVDRLRLRRGARSYMMLGLDAGTEDNTERSEDLPDVCSALGPVTLAGDPDGNEDAAVDSIPHQPVTLHQGIQSAGDLGNEHAWAGPVGRLTVVRLADDRSRKFSATLSGFAESPPVATNAEGEARVELLHDGRVKYKVKVEDIQGATAAHIHVGEPGVNGPVVAPLDLVGARASGDAATGKGGGGGHDDDDDSVELEGVLGLSDFAGGPFAGDFAAFLDALASGELYVNVHSQTYPGGEVRGQLGAD